MIFITGATGFIGSHLIGKLKGNVFALVRNKSENLRGIEQVIGDLNNPRTYKDMVKKCDTVIHLASVIDEMDKDLWKVNVEGTKKLLDVCDGQRFIHMSSIGIYGEVEKPIDERAKPNPETKYEESKLASEYLVQNSGLPYTILRPTMVYGVNKYWLTIIKLAKKNFPLIGDGKNYFHTVFVDDVTGVIIKSMGKKHVREDYNLAAHEPLTLNQTYETIKEVLGVKQKTLHVPESLTYAVSHITQFIPNTVLIPAHVKRLTRNRIYDVKKAEKNGLSCKTKFYDGMKKVVAELKII